MESVQLEHENVTQLVLVSLRDGVEEGRGLSNEEKDPFQRIERGAVVRGENLMYGSVEGH
jgi:small subunit ribosomal protein S12